LEKHIAFPKGVPPYPKLTLKITYPVGAHGCDTYAKGRGKGKAPCVSLESDQPIDGRLKANNSAIDQR